VGLQLKDIVPWGRSLAEYIRMFDLKPIELELSILDCASGPASFAAEMTKMGHHAIACDPIYSFSASEIANRIDETYDVIITGVKANLDNYIWSDIKSPGELGQVRITSMRKFLEDYAEGLKAGRYVTASLPDLPFTDKQFDLALCSHFLFSYSELLSLEFHIEAIEEMCRVAGETRIFPLLDISGEPSPWLEPTIKELQNMGMQTEIRTVSYEFQPGGNQMLQIKV
jgi:SAM-dependent methyltransferase